MTFNLPSTLPYPLTQSKVGYEFTTELGEHYALYSSDASGYFEGYEFAPHALMPGLARLSMGRRSPHDPRVMATVFRYIEQSFADSRTILVYVCDQTDNLQQQRHRLFNQQFVKYNNGRYLKRVLVAEQTLYASMLYRRDNPFGEAISYAIPALKAKFDF